jgi:thioredoxin 1
MPSYDAPINANDASFERVALNAPLPIVAVVWSPDETDRGKLNALLTESARSYAGEAGFAKLEAADAPQTRARYAVGALPEFLFLRQGNLIARAKGMPSLQALRPWIEYLLERGPRPATRKPQPQAAPSDGHPVVVSDATFEQVVLRAFGPVLVDFWASWCGPCRMVAPIVEKLAGEFAGRATVAKLDVDANPATSQRFGVQSIPTLIYFKGGEEVGRVVGAGSADVLRQKLAALV